MKLQTKWKRFSALLLAVLMAAGMMASVYAEGSSATVDSVTAQLEAIDTLQQMQNNRSKYTVKYHYDSNTTSTSIITDHLTKRENYETYLADMFAARAAAQEAYDSLTPEEQAQIDPTLVAKLDDTLETTLMSEAFPVSPAEDEYVFETVAGPGNLIYEASTSMAKGETPQIPQTFIVVDTSDGKTSWTPSDGQFVNGVSNFDVAYCADIGTGLEWGHDYRRINLEDGTYYSDEAARRIRAIVRQSYPYVSIEQMKQNLKDGGMDATFVDSLTRSDLIAAVQMAIWAWSNPEVFGSAIPGYFASICMTGNTAYFVPLHDYTNEIWEWLPNAKRRTFDADAEYRVNNLLYYLTQLEGEEAATNNVIVSDIQVGRVDLIPRSNDLYNIGLHVMLNTGCQDRDNVVLTVTSYSEDAEGNKTVTATNSIQVGSAKDYTLSINAKVGDTIEVTTSGTKYLERDVYLYEARGGASVSQTLVGMSDGETPVYAVAQFTFREDVEMGLRIYKKSTVDQAPISDITFHVYEVETAQGEILNPEPTAEEIAKYAVAENLVGSIVTDSTGYACLELPQGTYLVVEEHNAEKVLEPAAPFYIYLPWPQEKEVEGENGTEVEIEYLDVVSVYPKNTPVTPPPPPPPPEPEGLQGCFELYKHDSANATDGLAGAEFQVYRAATEDDAVTETLVCGGETIRVVPVTTDEGNLILVTDNNGSATSPYLSVGQYYIKEIKAPIGYIMPTDGVLPITVVASTMQEQPLQHIPNDRGFVLPATGGVGTAAMSVAGAAMVFIAVLLWIAKRRTVSE